MKKLLVVCGIASVALVLIECRPIALGQNTAQTQRISVDDIGRSVTLMGRLGVPIGQKMVLTGHWHFPKTPDAKDGSIRFTVTDVNETKLQRDIEFNHEQLRFTDREHHSIIPEFGRHRELENQVWTLTAYETGGIQITPDEYPSKTPVFPVVGMPYYTAPFTSAIVGVLKRNEGRTTR